MTKKQISQMAKRWNGISDDPPREPAGEYNITIIVESEGAEMKIRRRAPGSTILAMRRYLLGEPAGEYNITIIVESEGAEMKIRMPGIAREEIMKPGYERGIQLAVQNFEHFVYGLPLPPEAEG